MPKEIKKKIIEDWKEELEIIVRRLIILGYEMGKKQMKTSYKYTCDTDKGEKYWKQIRQLLSQEKQKWVEEILPKEKHKYGQYDEFEGGWNACLEKLKEEIKNEL